MSRLLIVLLVLVAIVALVGPVLARPVQGTYNSPSRGGAVLIGRASVSRQSPNSGNPKVFNGQSWNGSILGTQWEIRCGLELTSVPPNTSQFNPVTGTGWIMYHQTFLGGTFAIYNDPAVGWGFGSGTLNTTSADLHVYLISWVPYASSFTATTSGNFDDGCHLEFAMSNGFGVGETHDPPPSPVKPPTYPAFLAPNCLPADANHQFGIWADVNDIVAVIGPCQISTQHSSWGQVKTIYR